MKLPIDSINRDTKIISNFETVFKMGKHYNIFKDLFEQAYFKPSLDINVEYHDNNVYYGNKILASRVSYQNQLLDSLFSLHDITIYQ